MNVKLLNFLYNRFSRVKYINRWIIFFSDLTLSVCSTGIALLFIRYTFSSNPTGSSALKIGALSILCSVVSILCFRIYKGVIRHSGFIEAGRLGIAALLKVTLLFVAVYMTGVFRDTQMLVIQSVTDVFLTFFLLVTIRASLILSYNYIWYRIQNNFQKDNLLIFENGIHTSSFFSTSLRNIEQTYRIAGFLNIGKNGQLRMNEYPVYSVNSQAEFDKLASRHYIKAVLFSDYASVKQEDERLIRYCERRKIRMLVLPSVDEVKDRKVNYRNLPEVRIEDLLDRKEIKIDMQAIAASLSDKTVMVTGAAGSIGSELCRQLCRLGACRLVLFDCAETPMHNLRLELEEAYPGIVIHPIMGDARNRMRVENTFRRFIPQIIFHAAAYKHVPLMEENPCESVCTNVLGTMSVADVAVEYGVEKFIMISTDKAVNPTNVMGASKRLAEIYVQSLGTAIAKGLHKGKTRFITTRFGNVLGSNGSVIPRFREQLLKGGPLTVTHPDIIRYFMTIPEACRLVLEAGCIGEGNEIFVFDMGNPVKIDTLARRMIELAGLEPDRDIRIEYSGLRSGEKLYEELLAAKEENLPTSNETIYRARVREYEYNTVLSKITTLCELARNVKIMETVRLMKELVPEFISRHSKFECLDGNNGRQSQLMNTDPLPLRRT
jgi:FlaA1/EpsC-like NDP-sugar epimerase